MHITDWMPTLLHLAGASDTSELDIDGVNQWDSISTGSSSPREVGADNSDLTVTVDGCNFLH